MSRIDDDTPKGATHNSMSGSARQVVQAGSIGSVIIERTFGRRSVIISTVAISLICIALFVLRPLLSPRPDSQASGRAASQTPLAAVVFSTAVPCRSGWVVPDHGQKSIPYNQDEPPVGAVLGSDGNVIITVQGTDGKTVVLQSMTVVIVRRTQPVAGIYLPAGCQGEMTPRRYAVDLDSPTPRIVPQPGNAAFPYTVSGSDPEQFVITPSTMKSDVLWRLDLEWSMGAEHGKIALDDSGEPFRTTAITAARRYCNGATGWGPVC
jgi:hypothetical protein